MSPLRQCDAAQRTTCMFFNFQSACLPSLNDWRNVLPELVENRQLLGKAEGRTLSATQRLLGKDIRDIRVLLRSAHGIEFNPKRSSFPAFAQ